MYVLSLDNFRLAGSRDWSLEVTGIEPWTLLTGTPLPRPQSNGLGNKIGIFAIVYRKNEELPQHTSEQKQKQKSIHNRNFKTFQIRSISFDSDFFAPQVEVVVLQNVRFPQDEQNYSLPALKNCYPLEIRDAGNFWVSVSFHSST